MYEMMNLQMEYSRFQKVDLPKWKVSYFTENFVFLLESIVPSNVLQIQLVVCKYNGPATFIVELHANKYNLKSVDLFTLIIWKHEYIVLQYKDGRLYFQFMKC